MVLKSNVVVNYIPCEWQKRLHGLKARVKYIWAGRRAGKGRAVIQEALSLIEEASRKPFVVNNIDMTNTLVPPIHIWTVAPTRAQMRQVWNEMKAFIPPHLVKKRVAGRAGGRGSGWKEDELYVELELRAPNGKWLPGRHRKSILWELKSADNPESLQTVGLDFLHIAEAQDIKEAAWNKVRPTLNSPGRVGRACIEGIPPISRSHWFSRRFRNAEQEPTTSAIAIKATTFDNHYLSPDQLEDINRERDLTTDDIWRRHYLAEQAEGAGGFFNKIHEASTGAETFRPNAAKQYVAGLDLGKQVDPTVLIIKDRVTRESVYAVEMLKTDWVLQKDTIAIECANWKVQEVRIDSSGMGGDVIYDELLSMNVPVVGFKFTQQSKYQLFLNYAIALQNGTVQFPSTWDKLKNQMEAIEVKQLGMGYSFSHPDSTHDDWVDAECLALMACDPAMVDSNMKQIVPSIKTFEPLGAKSSNTSKIIQRIKRARRKKQIEEAQRQFPDLQVNGIPLILEEDIKWQ